jgi:hypothetical protein
MLNASIFLLIHLEGRNAQVIPQSGEKSSGRPYKKRSESRIQATSLIACALAFFSDSGVCLEAMEQKEAKRKPSALPIESPR